MSHALAIVLFLAANEPTTNITVDLGGLRQAKAALTVLDSDYRIKVRMLPVSCFDSGTNARLNRDKARRLALQALAKHLSGKKSVELTVSGAQVEKFGTDGKFYTLSLRVPRDGVSMVREAGEPPPAARKDRERVAFNDDLFTRKHDYTDSLEKLAGSLSSELEKAAKPDASADSFSLAIAEIEERETANLENLEKEIGADRLLLDFDRGELTEALKKQRARMMDQLRAAVKKHETKEKSP